MSVLFLELSYNLNFIIHFTVFPFILALIREFLNIAVAEVNVFNFDISDYFINNFLCNYFHKFILLCLK